MRVLIAHNRYQSRSPSGENRVVEAEIDLLRSAGVQVETLIESSDDIPDFSLRERVQVAAGPLYSRRGAMKLTYLVEAFRPDLLHVHNVFPLISPATISVATSRGIPVIQTVHNYRHTCVNGLHFRDGSVCVDCVGKLVPYPAVRHGCYRGSRAQSIPMALSQTMHSGTWRKVSRYLALTPFMAAMLTKAGIAKERIIVRPSWVSDPGPAPPGGSEALFVGRLDQAKGVRLLLDAWEIGGRESVERLRILGDGPLRGLVEDAAGRDSRIRFEGAVPPQRVAEAMRHARFLVFPSLWFEGYPLVIAEAFARSTPVLAVEGGSAASVVCDVVGWRSPPEASALAKTMNQISDSVATEKGAAARRHYERVNSPRAGLHTLLEAYEQAQRHKTP